MNELALSNNLQQIELEIDHHKRIAGESIWEIGRRLNHVKENDLAHGQFIQWLNKVGIERTEAHKMMKVATELPNVATLQHLGTTALHLLATLPAEEQAQQIQRIEAGDNPTVRELQEAKRQLKLKDQANDQLRQENERLKSQPSEVVREVEVIPEDYYDLQVKADDAVERNQLLEKKLKELHAKRSEVDEKSAKYDELTEAIKQSQGQLNSYQRKIASYKNFMILFQKADQLIMEISGLAYSKETQLIDLDGLVKSEFNDLVDRGLKLFNDLDQKRQSSNVLEGEIL